VKKNVSQAKRPRTTIPEQLKLWLRAGGRCEFNGCNEHLSRDDLTLSEANFSNIAHIVAWTENGPRGKDPLPPNQRNLCENLMLVCRKHHKLIDDSKYVSDYPTEKLLTFKREHEERIERLTAMHPDRGTTVIRFKANVGGEAVEIPKAQIEAAIEPMFPTDTKGIEVDLTKLPGGDDPAYWRSMGQGIEQYMQQTYMPGIQTESIKHVSVFALGPIPLLIAFGYCLSNKVPAGLYQRHRDTEDWTWKKKGSPVSYQTKILREGKDDELVALVLSLSGTVALSELPHELDQLTVYEITLAGGTKPDPGFLRQAEDLETFRELYQGFLRDLRRNHPGLQEIHLFPAVPAPVAVTCGRELMHKVDPTLVIYDNNKNKGGFRFTLNVN